MILQKQLLPKDDRGKVGLSPNKFHLSSNYLLPESIDNL